MKTFFLLSFLLLLFTGCSQINSADENPGWINTLIEKFKSEPVGNPPQSIWRYECDGQTFYYIPPQCCDQFSSLYNSDGSFICAPDGGITGKGDQRCPDFIKNCKNRTLIWQDNREKP
jgi:hypothetical protein